MNRAVALIWLAGGAAACYLGLGQDGKHYFKGSLDHVRIYSRVLDDFDKLPAPPPPAWDDKEP